MKGSMLMKKISLPFFGIIFILGGFIYSYILLHQNKINGAEFVAMFLGNTILGIAIALLPNVSEMSIAGNVLKLREVEKEAEKSIEQLKATRLATFRMLFNLVKRLPGGLGELGIIKDDRVDDFWEVFNSIEDSETISNLKEHIINALKDILKGQLHVIMQLSEDLYSKFKGTEIPDIDELSLKALDLESIKMAAKRQHANENEVQLKIIRALDEYKKMKTMLDSFQKANK
jgi:hypothetical protein